jgi:hypothetical protein
MSEMGVTGSFITTGIGSTGSVAAGSSILSDLEQEALESKILRNKKEMNNFIVKIS